MTTSIPPHMVPTVTVGLTYDTTLSGVMQAFSRVKGKKLPADRKGARSPGEPRAPDCLEDDTDEPPAPLVDNALEGLLELEPRVHGHPIELSLEVLVDQLVEGAAEDIALPDPHSVSRCPRWGKPWIRYPP